MLSREMKKSIKNNAEKLNEKNQTIRLEEPFNGILISLNEPEDEKLKSRSEKIPFAEIGLSREGHFYLIIERMFGKRN